jgi:hypothetical protein
MVSWAALLDEAVKKPGFIYEAYSPFHTHFTYKAHWFVLAQTEGASPRMEG